MGTKEKQMIHMNLKTRESLHLFLIMIHWLEHWMILMQRQQLNLSLRLKYPVCVDLEKADG